MRRAWVTAVALLACASAPAHAELPSVKSGARPGPDLLYAKPPRAPQLENTGPWKAEPILISGGAYRDGEFLYRDFIYQVADDPGADRPFETWTISGEKKELSAGRG